MLKRLAEKFKNIGRGLLQRPPPLSDLIIKQNLSATALDRIARELERQIRESGFSEKADMARFEEIMEFVAKYQEQNLPHDIRGFAYLRMADSDVTEVVAVTFRKQARFRHVFVCTGELVGKEAVYVGAAHLDEMVDGAWAAKPVRKILTEFSPRKIIKAASDARHRVTRADRMARIAPSAGD